MLAKHARSDEGNGMGVHVRQTTLLQGVKGGRFAFRFRPRNKVWPSSVLEGMRFHQQDEASASPVIHRN